jgi:DNA-binding NarL/FixJ family response regulator
MNKTMNILVVDDVEMVRHRIAEIINELEFIGDITHAGNFEEGLQKLELVKPDLVLLDISLPDRNGIELLRHISRKYAGTKVIVISNHANEYYKNLCSSLGALYFVDKSKDYDLIPEYISKIAEPI